MVQVHVVQGQFRCTSTKLRGRGPLSVRSYYKPIGIFFVDQGYPYVTSASTLGVQQLYLYCTYLPFRRVTAGRTTRIGTGVDAYAVADIGRVVACRPVAGRIDVLHARVHLSVSFENATTPPLSHRRACTALRWDASHSGRVDLFVKSCELICALSLSGSKSSQLSKPLRRKQIFNPFGQASSFAVGGKSISRQNGVLKKFHQLSSVSLIPDHTPGMSCRIWAILPMFRSSLSQGRLAQYSLAS